MIFKHLALILLFLTLTLAQQSLVVTSHSHQKQILDTNTLINHLASNPEIKAILVQPTETVNADVIELARKALTQANIEPQRVSSFFADHQELNTKLGQLMERFEVVGLSQLAGKLAENPEAVVHFSRRKLAQVQQESKSKLFLNMTPSILSGLLVTLFLLIVLCIGVSCLYDIKTNDKFARNNLWVGKQS